MSPEGKYGSRWSREETILALHLYCRIPFSHATKGNKEVIALASLLGRTPSSVARKLGNLGAFDDRLAERGIVGLSHTSKRHQEVWDEFSGDWERLAEASERILAELGTLQPSDPDEEEGLHLDGYDGPTEREALVKARRAQRFFRDAVLASYGSRCCFCAADLPQLIVAGHIIPWSVRVDLRADPRNGLALCALHDRAYDRGLVTVRPDYHIATSPALARSRSEFVRLTLSAFEGRTIVLPSRFLPHREYLEWHGTNRFIR